MSEIALTDTQIENMRHALGLTNAKQPYRNHYAAAIDGPDAASWDELVKAGYATVSGPCDWLPYRLYRITDAGRAALLKTNTKVLNPARRKPHD